MRQRRLHSLAESAATTAAGFAMSVLLQLFLFPRYGIRVSLRDNLEITLWFTLASFALKYAMRRAFDRMAG